MFLNCESESIRFTGRWDITETEATTTASGGTVEIAFEGKKATLFFNTDYNAYPMPHLWISVDKGAKIEVPLDRALKVEAVSFGNHVITASYKGGMEKQHRWHQPLVGKITFKGAEVEKGGTLPKRDERIIEFIGDSITEGVMIYPELNFNTLVQHDMPLTSDSQSTYAYLTARALGMIPVTMGYGSVGVTQGGAGGVPKAKDAYPYNFEGSQYKSVNPYIIVINHGANDRTKTAKEYTEEYYGLLKVVRSMNPCAKIVVLSAFCVVHPEELEAMVDRFNTECSDTVYFIDSKGWIPAHPLHPQSDGHRTIAEHLTKQLIKLFPEIKQ